MIPWEVLLEHSKAVAIVWAVVLVAGMPLSVLLRAGLGFAGQVLLGIVYWSVALYVFRFEGGLWVALALGVAGSLVVAARWWQHGKAFRCEQPWAVGVLVVGCVAYGSLLLWNFVPPGMDATMVGNASQLISLHQSLPASYAPWFADLPFPTINLGLPTVGGVAIGLGGEPASVVLGLALLSYPAWILATYLLLRPWAPPIVAAVLAVTQAWGARWAQNTIGWGGFTTVASMAIGLLAVRLMWETTREHTLRRAVALGLTTAAIPLVHGISAAVWLVAVAPVVGLTCLLTAQHRLRTAATLLGAAAVGAVALVCYLLAGRSHLSPTEVEWTLKHIISDSPMYQGWHDVIPAVLHYLHRYSGSHVAVLGAVSIVVLLFLRPGVALALLACLTLLAGVLANAQVMVLPLSMLLYPNRAVFWAGPLAALAAGLAWQALSHQQQTRLGFWRAVAVALLVIAASQHVTQYQRIVWQPAVCREGWEALRWARVHLSSPGTCVQNTYGFLGAYFPLCAGVPVTGCHMHHAVMDEWGQLVREVRPTHQLYVHGVDPEPPPSLPPLFRNSVVTIVELPPTGQVRSSASAAKN